jgi:menaquinone-dependent protoporphyrinogen oxidase
MNILVAVASRHGSTREIASAIAGELEAAGHRVTTREIAEAVDVSGYDAVVLGSAVYIGNWMPEARQFIDGHHEELALIPVWLFSSGPIGVENPKPEGDPNLVPEFIEKTGAREHRIFTGKLDPKVLGLGERLITRIFGAPAGDFRDWEDIRAWAREIARELASEPVIDAARAS